MDHTYLAVTIGPIVKTLMKARSTKEVWAASYLISYLMKQLVLHFKETHVFISPLAKDSRLFASHGGAGLFPDRLIFKQKKANDFDKLTECIEQVISDLVNGKEGQNGIRSDVKNQLKVDYYTTPKGEGRVRTWDMEGIDKAILAYFQQYFKIYAVEISLEEKQNVRQQIDLYLNSLELQTPLMAPETVDYIAALLRGIYGRELTGSLLLEDGFGSENSRPFPSLFEIATSEFVRSDKRLAYVDLLGKWFAQTQEQTREMIKNGKEPTIADPDDMLLKGVKLLMGDSFRRRHKYIAIVQADGDGMGKVNQAIFEGRLTAEAEKLLAEVDGKLLNFSLSAIKTIDAFGGRPIYLGGDDLLFFAPVMGYIDDIPQSVFDLVKTLSVSFDNQFSDDEYRQKLTVRPALSFGVSITYYKYPMFEALGTTRHLLEGVAKGVKGKNALAFEVLKNSQQKFGATYSKSENVFTKHLTTINDSAVPDEYNKALIRQAGGTDDTFLTSVQHVLTIQQNVLCVILTDKASAKNRLGSFFKNNFNEPVHSQKEAFLLGVADLLFDAFVETNDAPKAIGMAHATLRFIQFLYQPDLNDDD